MPLDALVHKSAYLQGPEYTKRLPAEAVPVD
jgi:hypothetical protein